MTPQSNVAEVFDLDTVHTPETRAPSQRSRATPLPVLPQYLEHRPGVDDVGKLSAQAIAQSYEHAAQEVERLGAELNQCVKKCEEMKQEASNAFDEIKEVAAQFREAGKAMFLRIEDCSLMVGEVRRTCVELKNKIAIPPTP